MQLRTRVFATTLLCFLALGTMATAQNQYVILYPGPFQLVDDLTGLPA